MSSRDEQSTAVLPERTVSPGDRSGKDRLADKFLPVYRRYFTDQSDFVHTVDKKLGEAVVDEPVETFLSLAIGYGVITGLTLWILSTLFAVLMFVVAGVNPGVILGMPVPNEQVLRIIEILKVPLLILTTGLTFGTLGLITGFFAPIVNVYLKAGERKREIETLLPDAVAFMYALSIGGMNQLDILESVAKADDVYGEISTEFEIILQETRYFGVDYRTAIRNRALETPSDDFGQFLTDMLSILSSGGDMTTFLDDQKDKFIRTATQQQQRELETLELFGEMYMTLSLFPLLLVILLVIFTLMGNTMDTVLMLTVYVLIPMLGGIFLVLIATVKQDDPGDGYLIPEKDDPYIQSDTSALGMGVIEQFTAPYNILDQIRSREGAFKAKQIMKRPDKLFLEQPAYTFAITVPVVLVMVFYAAFSGLAPTSFAELKEQQIWGTFIYLYFPMYVLSIPYATFYEIRERSRKSITTKLSDNLRKLASANDTGQTLLKSFKTVADTSGGKLAREFEIIYNKVQYGTSMKQAIIEFNNKYHQPRLARMMKLISKAQETSSQITPVLKTAASASEQQDVLAAERKQRTRMQVVIIMMTYFTLLAVMVILRVKFLGPMSELSNTAGSNSGGAGGAAGGSFGGNVDVPKLSLFFFHAVTLQGITAAMIAGYLRTSKLQSGVKFLIILPTFALLAWIIAI